MIDEVCAGTKDNALLCRQWRRHMEQTKQELIQLFEEMLTQIKHFKRKTYEGIFKDCYDKYKGTVAAAARLCEEAPEDEREAVAAELALVIPDYAFEKMQALSKGKKERFSVDYNMNMAVYVVPMLTYTHNEYCEKIASKMVEAWNEKGVTTLTLGQSSYDDIAGGFKKGFCFITTAVCEQQDKPDDCYELRTLRAYRDDYMMSTEDGKALVEEYYDIAPGIVQIINMQKDAEHIYEALYKDCLAPCISCIEAGEKERCKELYTRMVRGLQKKYLYS
ncbi:CFI-box-CTERM domain-containing protein [[Clostridium] hylemonae]|uniref:CFI-box-CTERM domain-containing protein n=2 Tax=[Clostridium] hylemonae TaxID=89153 RepID=UPI0014860E91|nr:CFI-box-CTERM domain-containing protein [[Clostridium] hylemonae]